MTPEVERVDRARQGQAPRFKHKQSAGRAEENVHRNPEGNPLLVDALLLELRLHLRHPGPAAPASLLHLSVH